jgi:hypothetical protein
MFRASQRPSSGVSKTVSATSGIGHGIGTTASFHRGLIRTGVGEFCGNSPTPVRIRPRWKEVAVSIRDMTYTRGSRYSFLNSWRWTLWRPKHVEFDVAANKCLSTDASSWFFLLILNRDARNHEFKKMYFTSYPLPFISLKRTLLY